MLSKHIQSDIAQIFLLRIIQRHTWPKLPNCTCSGRCISMMVELNHFPPAIFGDCRRSLAPTASVTRGNSRKGQAKVRFVHDVRLCVSRFMLGHLETSLYHETHLLLNEKHAYLTKDRTRRKLFLSTSLPTKRQRHHPVELIYRFSACRQARQASFFRWWTSRCRPSRRSRPVGSVFNES